MKPFEVYIVKCIVFSFRLGKGTAVATVPFLFQTFSIVSRFPQQRNIDYVYYIKV